MDPWTRLRATTRSRIGLGRSGDGLPTKALLEFQLGHARARDAVHGLADFDAIRSCLGDLDSIEVKSFAKDRAEYLLRPDLGRRLAPNPLLLQEFDIALVIADGLSAMAVNDHAAQMVKATLERLGEWKIAPVILVRNGRVAIGDEIAMALGAKMVAVLIGERPGLTVPNSLGIYLTCNPKVGTQDSERNCISNIHHDGLSYEVAAQKLVWLATEARKRGMTGVMLKEAAEGTLASQGFHSDRSITY